MAMATPVMLLIHSCLLCAQGRDLHLWGLGNCHKTPRRERGGDRARLEVAMQQRLHGANHWT